MARHVSSALLIVGMAVLIPHAKATMSLQFTTDQKMCCGTIILTSISSTEVGVTVTLGTGETFVNTGNGSENHPGFAFNIAGDPLINITNITTNKTSSDFTVGKTNDATGGPSFGTFDYTLITPGSGASAGVNQLSFDVTLQGGGNLALKDFVVNSSKYFFETDIGLNGNTAESGSLGPGTPLNTVPEPTSVALLTTLVAGCLLSLRKRRSA